MGGRGAKSNLGKKGNSKTGSGSNDGVEIDEYGRIKGTFYTEGFTVKYKDGTVTNYYITKTTDGLPRFQINEEFGKLPTKHNTHEIDGTPEELKKSIKNNGNKVTEIPKKDILEKMNKLKEERKNKPDYETGNAFNQHGWGASQKRLVYRPRRNR